jgi:uncharacterized membrane protein YhaH (DUF805 family)
MSKRVEESVVAVCFLSALILAVSFVLPLTEYTTFVDANGRPVGIVGQLFPDPDSGRVTTYGFFWEDINWVVPVVFFLPALLIVLRKWGALRLRAVLSIAAPLVASCLLVPLVAMVQFADFGVFPGTGGERAYGCYVALGSLGCFVVASSILAASTCIQMKKNRPKKSTGRAILTMVCC